MKARVNKNSPQSCIIACGGVVFTRSSWTPVPVGREAEAKRSPFLEFDEVTVVAEPDEEKPVLPVDEKTPRTKSTGAKRASK